MSSMWWQGRFVEVLSIEDIRRMEEADESGLLKACRQWYKRAIEPVVRRLLKE